MNNSIAIYIHYPFCNKKCPYCDFNSYVSSSINHQQWLDAYIKEIVNSQKYIANKTISSVFLGGGTPSLMPPKDLQKILETINNISSLAQSEITIEANPETLTPDLIRNIHAAGVNRLSIGVQSFNNKYLSFLGRRTKSHDICAALESARAVFNNFSVDLIYGIDKQTPAEFNEDLKQALSFNPKHISLYQLTVEQSTPFYRSGVKEIDEDGYIQMQNIIDKNLEGRLLRYEVSNYSQKGFECLHNLLIWQGIEYLGIGPGAHGRLLINGSWYETYQTKNPNIFLENSIANLSNYEIFAPLSQQIRNEEILMSALRTSVGLSIKTTPLPNPEKMRHLIEDGLLELKNDYLKTTAKGLHVINSISGYLLT